MAVVELLDSRVTYLEPPVTGVQLLDSRVVSLEPLAEIYLLDSRIVTLEPLPEVGEVQLLDSRTVSLTPTEVPPGYKLIQHTEYPSGKTFVGTASQCTFEFKLTPEQIPGTSWLGIKIANAFADKVKDQGSEMLDLKIYEDTTPMFWTDYRVIATCIETSPFPWAIVIVLVLAILFVVAITFVIKEIKTLPWGKAAFPIALIAGAGALAVIGVAVISRKKEEGG